MGKWPRSSGPKSMNRFDSGDEFNEPRRRPNGVIIWSSAPLHLHILSNYSDFHRFSSIFSDFPKSARHTAHLAALLLPHCSVNVLRRTLEENVCEIVWTLPKLSNLKFSWFLSISKPTNYCYLTEGHRWFSVVWNLWSYGEFHFPMCIEVINNVCNALVVLRTDFVIIIVIVISFIVVIVVSSPQ